MNIDNVSKNNLIDFLESQDVERGKVLYGLLKEEEERLERVNRETVYEPPVVTVQKSNTFKNCLYCKQWHKGSCLLSSESFEKCMNNNFSMFEEKVDVAKS